MTAKERYYDRIVAAFVKGHCTGDNSKDLIYENLNYDDPGEIITFCKEHSLKINNFKRTGELPRVSKVLGIIKGLYPDRLLDIGSGKGVFLWPLVSAFPGLDITATDTKKLCVDDINSVNRGGVKNVWACLMDASDIVFEDNSFDIVTALEVLEHITEYEKVLKETLRVAKKFVIISVPSREDTNPDHINLFSEKKFRELFEHMDVKKAAFQYVPGHIIAVITKG